MLVVCGSYSDKAQEGEEELPDEHFDGDLLNSKADSTAERLDNPLLK